MMRRSFPGMPALALLQAPIAAVRAWQAARQTQDDCQPIPDVRDKAGKQAASQREIRSSRLPFGERRFSRMLREVVVNGDAGLSSINTVPCASSCKCGQRLTSWSA
jgi:hypothetical protein